MIILKHLFSTFFPEKCTICNKNLIELGNFCCNVCSNNITKSSNIIQNKTKNNVFENQKDFFSTLNFLFYYYFKEKLLIKKAKLENNYFAKKYILENLKKNFTPLENNKKYHIVPIPSSKKLVDYIVKKFFFKQLKIQELNLISKTKTKKEMKYLSKTSRISAIENLLFFNSNIEFDSRKKKDNIFILFDDVITTGTTIKKASLLLQEQGISKENIYAYSLFLRKMYNTNNTLS